MSSEAIQTLQSTFENECTDNSSEFIMDLETFAEDVLSCVEGKHIYEVPLLYTSALNVKVKKFNQARVNGGSNYDSLKVAKCLVI